MITAVQAFQNDYYDAFVEPFNQGYYNLRDAFQGTKIEAVANTVIGAPITQEIELSLAQRVTMAAIGLLLIIPIVNALVMLILKNVNSDYLYPASFIPPITIDEVPSDELEEITPEAMVERKRAALARLDAIEGLVAPGQDALTALASRFEPNANILHFNLDELLQRYQTSLRPSNLCDFVQWAGLQDHDNAGAFGNIVRNFNNYRQSDEHYYTMRGLLSNLAEYFTRQKARVAAGSDAENALKAQFVRVFDSLNDANNNCIDQTLSQTQTLILDVLAEGDTGQRRGSLQAKLVARAGLVLCKYRTSLLKEILVRQNPTERHMADFERAATQKAAEALGMQGNIFAAGARYDMVNSLDARIDRAVQTFIDEYKPLEHLLTELRTYHGIHQSLRNEMLIWATRYYDMASEEDPDPAVSSTVPNSSIASSSAAPNMVQRMSEDFNALPMSEGGNLTFPAIALLMESAGLIHAVSARP